MLISLSTSLGAHINTFNQKKGAHHCEHLKGALQEHLFLKVFTLAPLCHINGSYIYDKILSPLSYLAYLEGRSDLIHRVLSYSSGPIFIIETFARKLDIC